MKELYRTVSVCPVCVRPTDARVVEKSGRAVMLKTCPDHGDFEIELCAYARRWNELRQFHAAMHPVEAPSHENVLLLALTVRCNIRCPFCFMFSGPRPFHEPTLGEITGWLARHRHERITLYGGEPTVREDLPQILELVRASGNVSVLQTNGVKLADLSYCRELRAAGLAEVFLSYDSDRERRALERFRGADVVEQRLAALDSLERLGIPVFLSASVVGGVNDREMADAIDFALSRPCIRGVFFRSAVPLGPDERPSEQNLRTDQMLDRLRAQTGGRIGYEEVFRFMQLFTALQPYIRIQRCWGELAFVVFRSPDGGYVTIDEILDLRGLEPALQRYAEMWREGRRARATAFLFRRLPQVVGAEHLDLVTHVIGSFLGVAALRRFGRGATQRGLSSRTLLLMFNELCNVNNYDARTASSCPSKTYDDDGRLISFCTNNLRRQRRWVSNRERSSAEQERLG